MLGENMYLFHDIFRKIRNSFWSKLVYRFMYF